MAVHVVVSPDDHGPSVTPPLVKQAKAMHMIAYDLFVNQVAVNPCADSRPTSMPGDGVITGNGQMIGNLEVRLKWYFSRVLNAMSFFVSVTNPTNAAENVSLFSTSNLGSDGNTVIEASNKTPLPGFGHLGDTKWAVSHDSRAGRTPTDPVVTSVFQGPGSEVAVSAWNWDVSSAFQICSASNSDTFEVLYETLYVAPGRTVSFLILAGLGSVTNTNDNVADAIAFAESTQGPNFLASSNSDLISHLTPEEIATIVNFASAPPIPNPCNGPTCPCTPWRVPTSVVEPFCNYQTWLNSAGYSCLDCQVRPTKTWTVCSSVGSSAVVYGARFEAVNPAGQTFNLGSATFTVAAATSPPCSCSDAPPTCDIPV